MLSERIFARLREDFITSSVRLPLSVVERAGTGDLVARTTNDVESLAHIIRFGIPAIVVAVTTVVATTVAAFLTSPLAALSLLTAALVHVPTSRWYLKRAGDGYLWEHASYARLNGVAVRDGRGRPDDGRARAAGGPWPPFPGRARRVRRRRAATPWGCGCAGSRGSRSASSCPSRRRCSGAAGWPGTATSPSRPPPP